MITKCGDFLKKVIQDILLPEAKQIYVSPAIPFTFYLNTGPVDNGACLMNNQVYLCIVFNWD